MSHLWCIFHPLSCVTHVVTTTVVGGFFNTLTTWILNSVGWFLTSAGGVLTSASESVDGDPLRRSRSSASS